jgi:tetratricopeptide (TPR) repeat protein
MADCQALAESYNMDADLYFLTGETALAMDSYEEASSNFEQAYGEDATYDRALQIYGAYLDKDMEADGTRYLEAALSGNAKNAQDHCDRGRVYYYMDDYENATAELKQAIDGDNTEALALLGMVYMDQGDSANARTMFQQYVSQAENGAKGFNGLALCDIEDGDYDSALSNISSGIHVADAEDMQSLLFNEIAVYEKKLDFQTALQKANEYLGLYPDDKTVKKELAFLKTRVSGEDSSADSQLSD